MSKTPEPFDIDADPMNADWLHQKPVRNPAAKSLKKTKKPAEKTSPK